MPGRDQTGPLGKGAQTGKRRGRCSHLNGEEYKGAPEYGKRQGIGSCKGQGMDPGRGQGMGPGRGRSMNGHSANRHGIHGFGR